MFGNDSIKLLISRVALHAKCRGCDLQHRLLELARPSPGFAEGAITVRVMRHDRLLFVLVPLFLMVVGALVFKQIWLREGAELVAMEDKAL